MPYPYYEDLSEKQLKFAKYKWEFLRRHPKYIREWEDLQEQLEEKHGNWRPPTGELTKEEISFCLKWHIMVPLDPRLSWYEKTRGIIEMIGFKNGKPVGEDVPDDEALLREGCSLPSQNRMFKDLFFPEPVRKGPIQARDENDY